jgi:hypothetical protein
MEVNSVTQGALQLLNVLAVKGTTQEANWQNQ